MRTRFKANAFEAAALLTLSLVFLVLNCDIKPRSWWMESVIGVMASDSDWEALQGPLRAAFEKVVRTPQIERQYALRHVSEEDFDRYTKSQYLILLATLNSQGPVADIVNRMIADPEIRQGVESGDYYVFTQKDQWAQDQLMLVLVGKDIPTLRQQIENNSEFLYNAIDSDLSDRLTRDLLDKRYDDELEHELMVSYNWSMKLQRDFFIAQEFPKENFIWFRRMYPERWIFVRWVDGGDEKLLDPQWVIDERNRIGGEYYGGDTIVGKYLFSSRGKFLDRDALITTGLWENEAKVKGGPFKNYTFFDPLSRRVYMIDVACHVPEEDKIPYLRRLDIIAKTFKTIFDSEE